MIEKKIQINKVQHDPVVFFTGTDAEKEKAIKEDTARKSLLHSIIGAAGFRALEYTKSNGSRRILHFSTRGGEYMQFSHILPDGTPIYHSIFSDIEKAADAINSDTLRIDCVLTVLCID